MSESANIIKNSSSKVLVFVVNLVLTFFLTPFMLFSLGDGDYGIWVLIGSICGFYNFLDMGIGWSVIRYVSKSRSVGDDDGLSITINTSFFLFAIIGLAVLLLSVILAFALPYLVKIPQGQEATFSLLVFIIGAGIAFTFPFRTFWGVLQGVMRYDIHSGINIVTSILRVALFVVALTDKRGLLALAIITVLASAFSSVLYTFFAIRLYPNLKIGMRYIKRTEIKKIFNYSIYTLITSIGNIVRFNLDAIVIGAQISVVAIAPYAIAQKLVWYFILFVSEIFSVTMPLYSSIEAKGDARRLKSLFVQSTFYSSIISFFIASMLVIYGYSFIALWTEVEYAKRGYLILVILTVGFAVFASQRPTIAAAFGMERHRVIAIITVIESFMNLVLSVYLARKYGLVGVAIGTAIPLVVMCGIFQPVYICRVLDLSIGRYIKECFLAPSIITLIFLFVHFILKDWVMAESFAGLLAAAVISSIFFIVLSALFMKKEQREFWRGQVVGFKERFTSQAGG